HLVPDVRDGRLPSLRAGLHVVLECQEVAELGRQEWAEELGPRDEVLVDVGLAERVVDRVENGPAVPANERLHRGGEGGMADRLRHVDDTLGEPGTESSFPLERVGDQPHRSSLRTPTPPRRGKAMVLPGGADSSEGETEL